MKIATLLTTALFAAGSLPIFAMQPADSAQPSAPAATGAASPQTSQPGNVPESAPAQEQPSTPTGSQAGGAAATPAPAQPADLKPVSGELVSKLDSKTAKMGDEVVIQTRASVKTAQGTEIPKGSKLVGHVIAVQPSGGNSSTSQVAVNIDRAELKSGQTVPIHSEIQSLGTTETASDTAPAGIGRLPAPSSSSSAAGGSATNGGTPASSAPTNNSSPAAGYAPGNTPGTTAGNGPAPGTIVARTGHIAIRTTSVPGVLLANNAPGEQDPRMAKASGILLGAKKDVQLDSGTKVVIGVAEAGPSSATSGTTAQ